MNTDYPVVIVQLDAEDGGGFIGFVPDLPGCMSDGETRTEALNNTEAAIDDWLEAQADEGLKPPVAGVAAQKAEVRERALLDAISVLIEDYDVKERDIQLLRQRLAGLIKSLESDSPSRNLTGKVPPSLKPSVPKQTH